MLNVFVNKMEIYIAVFIANIKMAVLKATTAVTIVDYLSAKRERGTNGKEPHRDLGIEGERRLNSIFNGRYENEQV